MMLAISIAACSLNAPLSRRAAVGASLAAVLPAMPAFANNEGAAKYASGYVEPPKAADTLANIRATLYTPYASALAKEDYKTIGSMYAQSATVVDGTTKGPLKFVKGDSTAAYFAARGLSKPDLSIVSIVLEGAEQEIAHITYNVAPSPGVKPYAGLQKAVKVGGRWVIDEDVFPLENGKVYGAIKPQRNLLSGKVFMSLDPALRL